MQLQLVAPGDPRPGSYTAAPLHRSHSPDSFTNCNSVEELADLSANPVGAAQAQQASTPAVRTGRRATQEQCFPWRRDMNDSLDMLNLAS